MHAPAASLSHALSPPAPQPGNFMLASDAPDAPLKAVDFGLAVFFEPGELPRRDLGFEGTPWFMAPEVRSVQWSLSAWRSCSVY